MMVIRTIDDRKHKCAVGGLRACPLSTVSRTPPSPILDFNRSRVCRLLGMLQFEFVIDLENLLLLSVTLLVLNKPNRYNCLKIAENQSRFQKGPKNFFQQSVGGKNL